MPIDKNQLIIEDFFGGNFIIHAHAVAQANYFERAYNSKKFHKNNHD
jgi:hypothetical protein